MFRRKFRQDRAIGPIPSTTGSGSRSGSAVDDDFIERAGQHRLRTSTRPLGRSRGPSGDMSKNINKLNKLELFPNKLSDAIVTKNARWE